MRAECIQAIGIRSKHFGLYSNNHRYVRQQKTKDELFFDITQYRNRIRDTSTIESRTRNELN